jgi:hypothetical protein
MQNTYTAIVKQDEGWRHQWAGGRKLRKDTLNLARPVELLRMRHYSTGVDPVKFYWLLDPAIRFEL